jgi:hypothetical protein
LGYRWNTATWPERREHEVPAGDRLGSEVEASGELWPWAGEGIAADAVVERLGARVRLA